MNGKRADLHLLAAGLLEASANGYAAAAAAALHRRTDAAGSAETGGSSEQRAYFLQRILELAAALRMRSPQLFARRVAWLRGAALARGTDDSALKLGLSSLGDALREELPPNIVGTALEPIDEGLQEMARPAAAESCTLDAAQPAGNLALRYLEACLSADPERGIALVLDAAGTFSPAELLTRVLAPAEHEIGRMWHSGEASVAEERLVSETTRQLLAIIAYRFSPPRTIGRTALTAAVHGNIHDLGVRFAADLFRIAGWRSIFLGATMPADQLVRAAIMFGADLVILNATLVTQLGDTAQSIKALKDSGSAAKVLVGGAAFDAAPHIWQEVGADGYAATLDGAVAAGQALVES